MRPLFAVLFLLLTCAWPVVAQTDVLPEERFSKWLDEAGLGQFADALGKGGFYPIRAEGRLHDAKREFRIAFDRHPRGVHWWYCWYYNMDDDLYQTLHKQRLDQGYIEISHQEFTGEDGKPHHQVVWRKIEKS